MCRPDSSSGWPSLPVLGSALVDTTATAPAAAATAAPAAAAAPPPPPVPVATLRRRRRRWRRRRSLGGGGGGTRGPPPPCPGDNTTTLSSHLVSLRGGGGGGRGPLAKVALPLLVLVAAAVLMLGTFHRGFRRSVQFWTRVAPLVVEYKLLEWTRASHHAPPSWFVASSSTSSTTASSSTSWRHDYHARTAPKVVNIILDLGGIYIKIGQVLSAVGQAILPDEYVNALQPLQNGVKPRPIEEIRRIIETSAGKPMSSLFVEFDPTPIGSASIAQVHRARLAQQVVVDDNDDSTSRNSRGGEVVVVKVQYPEVAQQFTADLANLELVTRILAPDQLPMIRALRQRHENELDFRLEAAHLIECRDNLVRHWNPSPSTNKMLVTIPRVLNETGLCTRHVLVMEYLEGTPLAEVLEAEQVRLAKALRWLAPTVSSSSSSEDIDPKEARRQLTARLRKHYLSSSNDDANDGVFDVTTRTNESNDFPVMRVVKRHGRLLQALAPAGLRLLHLYANVRDGIERRRLNLARALKTLIRVHGLQLLRDGVYNADPHPGNVLVLPDGRLGLLDYGMVGRLSDDERRVVAQVVVALKRNERRTIADLYLRHGFKASFRSAPIRDANVLHRFATFHLDKIDLSSIVTESGEDLDLATLFRGTVVHSVPDWIAQARRLSGLLMGVTAQALRPVSLAHEWHDIAAHVLKQPPPPVQPSEAAASGKEGLEGS